MFGKGEEGAPSQRESNPFRSTNKFDEGFDEKLLTYKGS